MTTGKPIKFLVTGVKVDFVNNNQLESSFWYKYIFNQSTSWVHLIRPLEGSFLDVFYYSILDDIMRINYDNW